MPTTKEVSSEIVVKQKIRTFVDSLGYSQAQLIKNIRALNPGLGDLATEEIQDPIHAEYLKETGVFERMLSNELLKVHQLRSIAEHKPTVIAKPITRISEQLTTRRAQVRPNQVDYISQPPPRLMGSR